MNAPNVSIGIPVYNGGSSIAESLESLLAQSYCKFEIIISDNDSTDKTSDICRLYSRRDKRIRYVKQASNRGAAANFQFVLDEAVGEFFMWAAADDLWSKDFIERNVSFLEKNKDYIGSISKSINHLGDDGVGSGATVINCERSDERILQFLSNPGANARWYSVFRRRVIKDIRLLDYQYIAGDWAVIVALLEIGKLNCLVGNVGFFKGSGISSSSVKYFRATRTNFIERVIPYYQLSKYLIFKNVLRKQIIRLIMVLIKLNSKAVFYYNREKLGYIAWNCIKKIDPAVSYDCGKSPGGNSRKWIRKIEGNLAAFFDLSERSKKQ